MKRKIAIDFDGCIHSYTSKFVEEVALDEPVEGIKEFLLELSKDYIICIFSTRCYTEIGCNTIKNYMQLHNLYYDKLITTKENIYLFVDDRSIQFHGKWDKNFLDKIRNFKEWNYYLKDSNKDKVEPLNNTKLQSYNVNAEFNRLLTLFLYHNPLHNLDQSYLIDNLWEKLLPVYENSKYISVLSLLIECTLSFEDKEFKLVSILNEDLSWVFLHIKDQAILIIKEVLHRYNISTELYAVEDFVKIISIQNLYLPDSFLNATGKVIHRNDFGNFSSYVVLVNGVEKVFKADHLQKI